MGRGMERNRWETALRCLEIAVHPNTSNEEVLAAINGFRRTAGGLPLNRLWRELAPDAAAPGPAPDAAHLLGRLDKLAEENRALRRRAEEAEAGRATALGRLRMAEEAVRHIGEDLLVAEQRADTAERQLSEFRGAYGRISGNLRHGNNDLRPALKAARPDPAPPIHEPVQPFQHLLNTAMQRPDQLRERQPVSTTNWPWTA